MIKKIKIITGLFVLAVFAGSCSGDGGVLTPAKKNFIIGQYENTLKADPDPSRVPRRTDKDGNLVTTDIYDWTSGFFAGNLWYLYDLTGDSKWKDEAERRTEALDTIQYWSGSHDVGFMINCSYGNGLKYTGKEDYKKVMVQTAESLIKRFNPAVGCIKSWDYREAWDGRTKWYYPVIIDNMMNLELLFEATLLTGDKKYEDIALTHARTTMKNHYRSDYSSYHVVDYDTITGEVLDKATCQGYTDASSWARGQAWGLYGFTVCFRYTRDKKFLDFAEHIADYIINYPGMPDDMVPYWDYNVIDKDKKPEYPFNPADYPVIPRDASAAAITSSALFELSGYAGGEKGESYRKVAEKILASLASPDYFAMGTSDKYFILNHSVGSIPHGVEIDVPLVYADYYFLEALIRQGKTKLE
jgi:unsaturated chondroitin disaccharide hydrolase